MSRTRRLWAGIGLAVVFFAALGFGAVAADPLGAFRAYGRAALRTSGAHDEFFKGADGTMLHAYVLGPLSAERPVVLLHGLGAPAEYWTFTARALWKRGRTVILPDAPGSGASEAPPRLQGYGLAARVAAVTSLVEALGLPRFDLVGHSLGGWTAAAWALKNPHRLARLVLADSGGFTPTPDTEAARQALLPADRASARHVLDLLFFRKLAPVTGFLVDATGRNYGSGAAAATVRELGPSDLLLGREDNLPAGTVLIWGERDPLFPISDARRTASSIPGSRLLVLTGVGHDGPLEAPRIFEQALITALGMPPA